VRAKEYYYTMMVSTKWFLKNQNVFVIKEFHIIFRERKKERKKEREYYATSDDANVAQHSFATLQMAKHIPQLGRVDVESGVKEKKCAFYGS